MSRRRNPEDQEFGSDSFLDIIANIVGILIILIVVAGVKVARQAAQVASSESDPIAVVATAEPSDRTASHDADFPSPSVPFDVRTAISEQTEPVLTPEQLKELDQQIAKLTLEMEEHRSLSAHAREKLQQLEDKYKRNPEPDDSVVTSAETSATQSEIRKLEESIASVDKKASGFRATLAVLSKRQKYVTTALDQVAGETRRLRELLKVTEPVDIDAQQINHRLSPVGRSVVTTELHFRLKDGHVAYIPLDGLLDRMRDQVSARRSAVIRFSRYEGMVGPVGGFKMQYVVQKDSNVPLRALQQGNTGYRISIARWTILPADTLQPEKVDDALKLGSRFRQVLEATESDATITVWLYPEDFESFGRLRELAHRLNLRVAARPLPEGTEISGSPHGSRSTSQ